MRLIHSRKHRSAYIAGQAVSKSNERTQRGNMQNHKRVALPSHQPRQSCPAVSFSRPHCTAICEWHAKVGGHSESGACFWQNAANGSAGVRATQTRARGARRNHSLYGLDCGRRRPLERGYLPQGPTTRSGRLVCRATRKEDSVWRAGTRRPAPLQPCTAGSPTRERLSLIASSFYPRPRPFPARAGFGGPAGNDFAPRWFSLQTNSSSLLIKGKLEYLRNLNKRTHLSHRDLVACLSQCRSLPRAPPPPALSRILCS